MMTATSMLLIVLGVLSALCYGALWVGTGLAGPSVPHFLGVMVAAFILYAAACAVAGRMGEGVGRRIGMPTIVGGAVVFRLLMAGPLLYDDDIYRYHWDGRVLAHGLNPYAYAPDDPALARLRDAEWERISYRYVKTIYPPLSQVLTAVSYWVWPEPARIRVLAALFDLLTIAPIILILRHLRLPPALAIVYAWSPLPIKEFANTGHLDSVAIFLATCALYLLMRGAPIRSGIVWGLSFLAKTWTILLFPLYLMPRTGQAPVLRQRALPLLAFLITVAAGTAPFLGAGAAILDGPRTFGMHWEFDSGLFALEQMVGNALGIDGALAAKVLNAVLWLLLAGLVIRSGARRPGELLRRAGLLLGAALLLSPVCNPWYVCWLLPVLCVHRSPAWLAFTGLVMLSYLYYVEPLGHLDPAARIVEYCVLGALIAWEAFTRHPHALWRGVSVRARGA